MLYYTNNMATHWCRRVRQNICFFKTQLLYYGAGRTIRPYTIVRSQF